jgi:MFS family permease
MFVEHGLTPVQVSATLMAWSITGFVLQIPSGVLSDRLSRRWVLCAAQLARALGFLAWIFLPNFWGYLLGLTLWGVKSAFTNGTFEALLYDELTELDRRQDYARIIGRAQAVAAAAQLVAALSAAWAVRYGYTAVLVASLAATLGAAVAAVLLPRARRSLVVARPDYLGHLATGFRFALGRPLILWIVALAAVSQAFGGGLEGFWPVFGDKAGLPATQIALFAAAISGGQAVASVMAHRLRTAPERGFHLLLAATGLVLAAAAAIFQPWSVLLVVLVAGLFKVIDVNFDARLHDAIPTETRATLASVKSFAGQVAMTVVLGVFGPLAQATSYRMAFLVSGAAVALLGLAFFMARLSPPASRPG